MSANPLAPDRSPEPMKEQCSHAHFTRVRTADGMMGRCMTCATIVELQPASPPRPSTFEELLETVWCIGQKLGHVKDPTDRDNLKAIGHRARSALVAHVRELEAHRTFGKDAASDLSAAWEEIRRLRSRISELEANALTAEEARVFVERADADLEERSPETFAWARERNFETGPSKLRSLSYPQEETP